MPYKAILIIFDGVGDLPYLELGNKTPLEAANKPNIDSMAKEGETGFMFTISPGVIPGSDTAHLALFGYDPERFYQGRGVYEALGAGFQLEEDDVAFRANLATLKDNIVIDRRAGREDTFMKELYEQINGLEIEDVKIIAKQTTEHRGVVIFRGRALSTRVSDVDPHEVNKPILKSEPLDYSAEAERCANVLNEFTIKSYGILNNSKYNRERESRGLLPGNIILLRGAGMYKRVNPLYERTSIKTACVAGGALYKGIARALGMTTYNVEGATGDKNTNLKNKLKYVLKAKEDHDLVFLHIKATDSFGHDGKVKEKKEFIEKVDKEIMKEIKENFDVVIITGDHSTPCIRKEHSGDSLPVLFYGKNCRKDNGIFSESNPNPSFMIRGLDLINMIGNKIEKNQKFGE